MKNAGKVFLLAVLLCFIFTTSACSSRQNSAAGQPSTADLSALSSQSNDSGQTGAQPDNRTGQDKSGSQLAASQPKDPGDKSQSGSTEKPGTAGQVKPESKSGVPAKALVFTYNADCCESTRQFFDMHRDSVKDLENKYGNRVKFTWYDVAVKDEACQKEMLEMAKKVGVQNIPAFVVLDINGNVLTGQIGQLKPDEVNKIFEGLNR